MAKKIHLEPHLEVAELERRYREARDPVERSQYQIVWLLGQGKLTREVAEATGYSRGWIQELARRYNAGGPGALGDKRHGNPGGLWGGRKVAEWMAGKLRRPVGERRGWEYLRRSGYTPKVPRPSHEEADPGERAAFPKG